MVVFLVLSALALIAAINVIVQKHPIHSALSLVATFISLAGIYLQMQAEFIAAMQVVVYTGAIMVLFLLVIMLLNAKPERYPVSRLVLVKFFGIPLGLVFVAEVLLILHRVLGQKVVSLPAAVADLAGNTESIGRLLYTRYALPLELTSVLLLAAILGVVVLAKKEAE
jgi:NADH-quinone oxidoreductase subunit J